LVLHPEWENTGGIWFHASLLTAHPLLTQLLQASLAQLREMLGGLGHFIVLVLHSLSKAKRTAHISDRLLVARWHLLKWLSSLSLWWILRGDLLWLRLALRIHWWLWRSRWLLHYCLWLFLLILPAIVALLSWCSLLRLRR